MTGLTTPTAGDVSIIGTSIVHQPQAARFEPSIDLDQAHTELEYQKKRAFLYFAKGLAKESDVGKPEIPPPPNGQIRYAQYADYMMASNSQHLMCLSH